MKKSASVTLCPLPILGPRGRAAVVIRRVKKSALGLPSLVTYTTTKCRLWCCGLQPAPLTTGADTEKAVKRPVSLLLIRGVSCEAEYTTWRLHLTNESGSETIDTTSRLLLGPKNRVPSPLCSRRARQGLGSLY